MRSVFEDIDAGFLNGKPEPKAKIPKQGIGLNFDALERAAFEKEKVRLIKKEAKKEGKKKAKEEIFGESIKLEKKKAAKKEFFKKTAIAFSKPTSPRVKQIFKGSGPLKESLGNPFVKSMGNPFGKGKNILLPR